MGLNPSWESTTRSAIQEFPQHFMEAEVSLPSSQGPSTGPYSEPDESSPYHLILFLQDPI
jgi:hypothetical protein